MLVTRRDRLAPAGNHVAIGDRQGADAGRGDGFDELPGRERAVGIGGVAVKV